MKITAPFITACALSMFVLLSATALAQVAPTEGATQQQTAPLDDKFSAKVLKDKLGLDEHQATFIQEMQQEMQQRLNDESEAMKNDPAQLRQLQINLRQESRDRVREVLHPEQLDTYEQYISQEKEREDREMHGEVEAPAMNSDLDEADRPE